MINCGIEIFKENLSTNFALIAVFVKVAFKITKRLALRFILIHTFSFSNWNKRNKV